MDGAQGIEEGGEGTVVEKLRATETGRERQTARRNECDRLVSTTCVLRLPVCAFLTVLAYTCLRCVLGVLHHLSHLRRITVRSL